MMIVDWLSTYVGGRLGTCAAASDAAAASARDFMAVVVDVQAGESEVVSVD